MALNAMSISSPLLCVGVISFFAVMDWGLALRLGRQPTVVSLGGTPDYMAPEMAMGPIELIGLHSGIYLLGAILYEIVTGLRPHMGATITRCLIIRNMTHPWAEQAACEKSWFNR
jgi:serine/threonine protein kinase